MLDRMEDHGQVEQKYVVSEKAEMFNSSSISKEEIFNA